MYSVSDEPASAPDHAHLVKDILVQLGHGSHTSGIDECHRLPTPGPKHVWSVIVGKFNLPPGPRPEAVGGDSLRQQTSIPDWLIISKFNGTSTPNGSYSAKTGESTTKECYGSTV